MLLGVKPVAFLSRVFVFFALTYALWEYIAPAYTQLLGMLAQGAMWFSELFGPAYKRSATTVIVQGTGIFYTHRLMPGLHPPGIPADWVQANMVLLIPLMLATPAPTWSARLSRFALAMVLALGLQVIGLVVAIKTTWASYMGPAHYTLFQYKLYQFTDAFFQSFDTQLFPVAIWGGIHFRELLGVVRARAEGPGEVSGAETPPGRAASGRSKKTRAERRRARS